MTNMSFMKMKNYLLYEINGESNADSLAVNVSVSHREILRLQERLVSEDSRFKVVNAIDRIVGDVMYTDDLNASDGEARFFRIVKKQLLTKK